MLTSQHLLTHFPSRDTFSISLNEKVDIDDHIFFVIFPKGLFLQNLKPGQ